MTADRNLWKDDHDGDCPYKTQLAEAKKLAQWKKASPENLPKKGQFWVSINQASRIIHDCGYAHHDWAMSPSQEYLDYYFIAPPQSEKPSMKSTREIIATNWFGASQPEKEKP